MLLICRLFTLLQGRPQHFLLSSADSPIFFLRSCHSLRPVSLLSDPIYYTYMPSNDSIYCIHPLPTCTCHRALRLPVLSITWLRYAEERFCLWETRTEFFYTLFRIVHGLIHMCQCRRIVAHHHHTSYII